MRKMEEERIRISNIQDVEQRTREEEIRRQTEERERIERETIERTRIEEERVRRLRYEEMIKKEYDERTWRLTREQHDKKIERENRIAINK